MKSRYGIFAVLLVPAFLLGAIGQNPQAEKKKALIDRGAIVCRFESCSVAAVILQRCRRPLPRRNDSGLFAASSTAGRTASFGYPESTARTWTWALSGRFGSRLHTGLIPAGLIVSLIFAIAAGIIWGHRTLPL